MDQYQLIYTILNKQKTSRSFFFLSICKTYQNVLTVILQLHEFLVFVNLILQYPNNQHPVFHLKLKFIQIFPKKKHTNFLILPACNIDILLSDSGGRISTSAFECLCKATLAPAFKSSRSIVDKIRT